MCKPITDLITADVEIAMYELQFCDTIEKCNEWKKNHLGKESVIGQVLKALGEWK